MLHVYPISSSLAYALLVTLILPHLRGVLARTCYLPNVKEETDVTCTNNDNTNCCGDGSICLSNGFCLSTLYQPYSIGRGSCTDPKWGPNCTRQCIGGTFSACWLHRLPPVSSYTGQLSIPAPLDFNDG